MTEEKHSDQAALPAVWKFNETCKMLRMSRTKIDALIADTDSGFPKPFWIGCERYFLVEAIQSWMLASIKGSGRGEITPKAVRHKRQLRNVQMNFRGTARTKNLVDLLAKKRGGSHADVFEEAIEHLAKASG